MPGTKVRSASLLNDPGIHQTKAAGPKARRFVFLILTRSWPRTVARRTALRGLPGDRPSRSFAGTSMGSCGWPRQASAESVKTDVVSGVYDLIPSARLEDFPAHHNAGGSINLMGLSPSAISFVANMPYFKFLLWPSCCSTNPWGILVAASSR